MAQLTTADFARIWHQLYQAGVGKEELKAAATLPSKAQLLAAFQVLEDWWDGDQAQVKTAFDTALGRTTTAPLARKIAIAWMSDKTERLRAL